jgi:hypothetical protein
VSGPGLPAIPVELLPCPRLVCWHGEPDDDPATADALAVLARTYRGVIEHSIIGAGRSLATRGCTTAGGNDWTGWHLPDADAIAALAGVADAIAPSHWTIIAELRPGVWAQVAPTVILHVSYGQQL